jgi:hypothetical protein
MWPPQPGTASHKKKHGSQLVCVRYRQDPTGTHRYTTVELLVDHAPVRYHRNAPARLILPARNTDRALVAELTALGAEWREEQQSWVISRHTAARLGVLRRARKPSPK